MRIYDLPVCRDVAQRLLFARNFSKIFFIYIYVYPKVTMA